MDARGGTPGMVDPDRALEFITGGHATFTVKSNRTGAHLSYRVLHMRRGARIMPNAFAIQELRGPDNEHDWHAHGVLLQDGALPNGDPRWTTRNGPLGLTWVVHRLQAVSSPPPFEIWHAGACSRCGRLLTHPESLRTGIGPTCAGRKGTP